MNIYESICKVMEDVGAVTKNKQNKSGQPFMYRGIDDVMNALNPAMIKNKVFVAPEVIEQLREDRVTKSGGNLIYSICKIKYTFFAEDGTHVTATVVGEAFDAGDKATNKAMSIAFKYACFQVFCIPTEEMRDPDAESHETAQILKGQQPKELIVAALAMRQTETAEQKIDEVKVKIIKAELERTGITEKAVCNRYGVSAIGDITEGVFKRVMDALKKTKDKEDKNE